ncbi:MAG: hypothetical protein IPJ41_01665 [Phycisphaerales bacterium]|nr:hypothetical protein [Phycisphaerales bacterium]
MLTMGVVVLATMLPAALSLLFPWGPDARRERTAAKAQGGETPVPESIASALAWACIASLGILTVAGVSNPRYGLPACALVTPLVAYLARGASGAFVGKRPAIARAMLLGSRSVWPLILLVGAGLYVGYIEPHRRASSGREAGVALAASLPDGAEVWADEMIEARPEVLLYAVREAEARLGKHVRVRWFKPEFMPDAHPPGLLLLLRQDELVDEVARYSGDGRFGVLSPVASGEVHKYKFMLCKPSEPRG